LRTYSNNGSQHRAFAGKEVLLMKNKTIGSSFDDFFAEEGISAGIKIGMDIYENDYLEIDMIEVPVVKRVVFQFNKPVELKFS
jgi:hypothetical protein